MDVNLFQTLAVYDHTDLLVKQYKKIRLYKFSLTNIILLNIKTVQL